MRTIIHGIFFKEGQKKKRNTVFAVLICLIFLYYIPIHTGEGGAYNVPVIGWADRLVDSYIIRSLERAQSSYLITMALDSAIAVTRSAEVSGGFFVFGASVSPGELLSPLHDSVKMLSDFLTNIIILLIVEKETANALSFICFKIFLPLALIFYLAYIIFENTCLWAKKISFSFCKITACVWLIMPISAAFANFIDIHFITPKYESHINSIKLELKNIFSLENNVENISIHTLAQQSMETLRFGFEKKNIAFFKKLVTSVSKLAVKPDDIISLLMILLSQILFLVCVVQLLCIIILFFICKFFVGFFQKNTHEKIMTT